MQNFKEWVKYRECFDGAGVVNGTFKEFVELRDEDKPINELFGWFGKKIQAGLPTYRYTTDKTTGKPAYAKYDAGEWMPEKMKPVDMDRYQRLGKPKAQTAKPMGTYVDKEPTPGLEVINTPFKANPEKIMTFIKSAGIDVSKISPEKFNKFIEFLNKSKDRTDAMNKLREQIRLLRQKQGMGQEAA